MTIPNPSPFSSGYDHDAVVIYGDTDSVMINFGIDDMKKTMEIAKGAAVLVTKHFQKPIKLEFEKVGSTISTSPVIAFPLMFDVCEGLFPIFVDEQKTICWFVLDEP